MTGLLLNLRGIYNKDVGAAPVFSPLDLFSNGENGVWYDPSDTSTVWATTTATIQTVAASAGVTATAGNLVARIDDKSGNGDHATQATVAARPILRQSGGLYYLEFDGADDVLQTILPSIPATYSFAAAHRYPSLTMVNGDLYRGAFTVGAVSYMSVPDSYAYAIYAGTPMISNTAADTNKHVRVDTLNAGTGIIRIDGTQIKTGTVGTLALCNGTEQVRIGQTDKKFPVEIYDFLIINRVLVGTEISDVESYLAANSGVTL